MTSNVEKSIFFEIPSLTEWSSKLDGQYLIKNWFKNADRRYFVETLQKFVLYNKELFQFLGVKPWIDGSGVNASLFFSSSQFIGAIPLRSPMNGLQIGDFIVKPRFSSGSDDLFSYGELVSLLQSTITPEFVYSIPLKSKNSIKPPLYIQASKFIQLLYQTLLSNDWVRFQNRLNLLKEPKSEVAWNKYIENEYDPYRKLLFPCRENFLSQQHKEFFEIVYVYQLARKEVLSPHTPMQIRIQLDRQLSTIDNKLSGFAAVETHEIKIHQFDFPIIKQLKEQANGFLANSFKEVTGWRIDISLLYEKYIQYLFSLVSNEVNTSQVNNPKIFRSGSTPPDWSLKYLEPDVILIGNDFVIVIDAKYKSHFFNMHQSSEYLHEEHRKDLHQILAYGSFINTKNTILMICYPFTTFAYKILEYHSQLLHSKTQIILVGTPINVPEVRQTKRNLIHLIHEIKNNQVQRYS